MKTQIIEFKRNDENNLQIVKIPAKEMNAKYVGRNGGNITGTHYTLFKAGKGFVSLDGGKTTYILKGNTGKDALQSIIDAGGFCGEISYRQTI